MKGKYKSQSGENIEVLVFDSENKIAYATVSSSGESKWYAESEFSTWTKDGYEPIVETAKVFAEETPEQLIDEPEIIDEKPKEKEEKPKDESPKPKAPKKKK